MALKQTRKHFGFVIYSRFKDGVFIAVKRDAKVLTRYIQSTLSKTDTFGTGTKCPS